MKSIKHIPNIYNSTVLVRVDVNEPVDEFGVPQNTFRLRKSLHSIRYLLKQGAKVVLLAHLGNPEGRIVESLRLHFIAQEMSRMLGQSITKLNEVAGDSVTNAISRMQPKDVVMLENVMFDAREFQNSDELAYFWAKLADYYVNDAFSVSHREHSSVCAITKFIPSFAGIQLMKEVYTISRIVHRPLKPAVAIVGGAKIETKLPVITELAKTFDFVLVGGKIAIEYLELYGKAQSSNIVLPLDFVDETKKDIGPKSVDRFCELLTNAATIVWNGPMGKIEEPQYIQSTNQLINCIANNVESFSLIGGGETIDAVYNLHQSSNVDFISTGGGAMLEFIAQNGRLPGLMALEYVSS